MSSRIMIFCEDHGLSQLAKPAIHPPQIQPERRLSYLFTQRKDQKIQTPGTRARSTQLLCLRSGTLAPELPFLCSGLGLVSGRPCFQAIDRSNAWTALRRPLAGRSRSLNHPDRTTLRLSTALRYLPPNRCRGAKQYFSCLLTIPYFAVRCKSAEQSFQQRIVAPGL